MPRYLLKEVACKWPISVTQPISAVGIIVPPCCHFQSYFLIPGASAVLYTCPISLVVSASLLRAEGLLVLSSSMSSKPGSAPATTADGGSVDGKASPRAPLK